MKLPTANNIGKTCMFNNALKSLLCLRDGLDQKEHSWTHLSVTIYNTVIKRKQQEKKCMFYQGESTVHEKTYNVQIINMSSSTVVFTENKMKHKQGMAEKSTKCK